VKPHYVVPKYSRIASSHPHKCVWSFHNVVIITPFHLNDSIYCDFITGRISGQYIQPVSIKSNDSVKRLWAIRMLASTQSQHVAWFHDNNNPTKSLFLGLWTQTLEDADTSGINSWGRQHQRHARGAAVTYDAWSKHTDTGRFI